MNILTKHNAKKFISAIIDFLPLKIANDKYVPYFYVRPFRYITLITPIQKLRIKYWTSIASNYQPFKPFYCHKSRKKAIANESDLEIGIKNIYENGYTICSNFLEQEDVKSIQNYTDQINLDPNTKSGFTVKNLPSEISNKILGKLKTFHSHFFPNADFSKNYPSFIIRIDYSKTGIDPAPITANWHVDRFIPTLNAIYFPEGSDWGSFEKDIGNPVIDDKYIDYFSKFRQSTSDITNLRESEYTDLNATKKLFDLPPNSLLIGTHHMQHRRSPYSIPGKRIAIFIDFYDVLPRRDLKKYASKV